MDLGINIAEHFEPMPSHTFHMSKGNAQFWGVGVLNKKADLCLGQLPYKVTIDEGGEFNALGMQRDVVR